MKLPVVRRNLLLIVIVVLSTYAVGSIVQSMFDWWIFAAGIAWMCVLSELGKMWERPE